MFEELRAMIGQFDLIISTCGFLRTLVKHEASPLLLSALTTREGNGSNNNVSESWYCKELWGIFKVFLLLNEYRDPSFLFQN